MRQPKFYFLLTVILPTLKFTASFNQSVYGLNGLAQRRILQLYSYNNQKNTEDERNGREEQDTVRVRIWNVLASLDGKEISMRELGSVVGERRFGDLKSHLMHVQKQAKTVGNKSKGWKRRRGLSEKTNKVKVKIRVGAKGIAYLKLVL